MANLLSMAQSLIAIYQEIPNRCKNCGKYYSSDFDIEIFEQVWGNTSGGFEGFGGSAMTTGTTYVLLPQPHIVDEPCQVYFDGFYAYSVPYENKTFLEDVRNHNIAGKVTAKRKYSKEKNNI